MYHVCVQGENEFTQALGSDEETGHTAVKGSCLVEFTSAKGLKDKFMLPPCGASGNTNQCSMRVANANEMSALSSGSTKGAPQPLSG